MQIKVTRKRAARPVKWCGVTVGKMIVFNVTPTMLFQPSYAQCCFQSCQHFLINYGYL
jgi:hypothetical protein